MSKSVYSLVLADEVVEAIDARAAQQGVSRSLLVSHILAEYAGLSTPETRTKELLEQLGAIFYSKEMRVFSQSTSALTLRTAIRYKYNPALHYTVELWDDGETLGQVRVAMRSQSEAVKQLFSAFFDLWEQLEARYLQRPVPPEYRQREEKRYTRTLRRPDAALSQQAVGELVSQYVLLADQCMKAFFGAAQRPQEARILAEEVYREVLAENPLLQSV